MDNIITRLNHITNIINYLDTNDYDEYTNLINDNLELMNHIVSGLENSLNKYKLSDEKIKEIELENHKEYIITKNLFPFYWQIKDTIDHMELTNETS